MENSETVKVFSNASDNVITFDNKEEFMKYYNKHKDDMDQEKTRGLNIKYKIPSYKIGRQKNVITLFPIKEPKQKVESKSEPEIKPEPESMFKELNELLEIQSQLITKIENKVDMLLQNQMQQLPPKDLNRSQFKSMNPYNEYLNKSLGNL